MKKTLLCGNHMHDNTFTIDVIEENGKYMAKWSWEDDSYYHDVTHNLKKHNYHHFINEPECEYIVFGGWAFWLKDELK